jgi:hypothetical protein
LIDRQALLARCATALAPRVVGVVTTAAAGQIRSNRWALIASSPVRRDFAAADFVLDGEAPCCARRPTIIR